MMSFTSRDLMIDVLPAKNPFPIPGLVLCEQITAPGGGGAGSDDEEEDALKCSDATASPSGFTRPDLDLAALRQQLRQSLSR
jgi:hypothetical protein